MPRLRHIRGALRGFLGTYTSRYSTFDGYWLFGFVVEYGDRFNFDLTAPEIVLEEPAPVAAARALARKKFHEQMVKNKVEPNVVSASLVIEIAPGEVAAAPHWRNAKPVRFTVDAEARTGAKISESMIVYVAPHDPRFEARSAIK